VTFLSERQGIARLIRARSAALHWKASCHHSTAKRGSYAVRQRTEHSLIDGTHRLIRLPKCQCEHERRSVAMPRTMLCALPHRWFRREANTVRACGNPLVAERRYARHVTLDRGRSKAMHVERFGSARPFAARTCERLGSWLPARAVLCAHGIAEHCAGARRTERCHYARTTSSIDFASVTRPVDVRHAGILSRRMHAGTRVKRRVGSPRAHRYEFTRSDAWWICRSSIANHRTSLSLSRLALCTGLRAHVVLRGPPPM
jgi:hypothetical protein